MQQIITEKQRKYAVRRVGSNIKDGDGKARALSPCAGNERKSTAKWKLLRLR